MLNQMSKQRLVIAGLCFGALLGSVSAPALAVDWSTAKAADVELFFPGTTSLEWMYSKRDHDGAARYKKRVKSCRECHDGDEASYGAKIVAGGETESAPLGGRRGHVLVKAQAVHDGVNLHLRLEWPKASGPAAEQQDPDFDTKMTVMLDDGAVEEFTAGGCWAVCHIDSSKMPVEGDKKKYLADSRVKMSRKKGGGDLLLGDAELQKLLASGTYLEYWQARLNPGKPASILDGYILNERAENATATASVVAIEDGASWVLEFTRPLAGGPSSKAIVAGKTYMLGLGLHDQNTAGRYHLASLQYSLVLDAGDADLVAIKQ